MKNLILLTALVVSFLSPIYSGAQENYNPNQIIIDFADGVTQADIDEYLDLIDGTIIDEIDNDVFLIEIESFPIEYTDINGVEVVFYDVIDVIENDVGQADIDDSNLNYNIYSSPLNLDQEAEGYIMDFYSPIPGYGNNYPGELICASLNPVRKIKVGIIDTGIDPNHDFLNSYVVFEYNIINKSIPPVDDNGHGTKIAGIIAGMSQSAGISPDFLEIYSIKAFDQNGQGSLFDLLKSIKLLGNLDLDIVNLSWGFLHHGSDSGKILEKFLFKETYNKSLVICGAGNEGINLNGSLNMYSPADLYNPSMITIGAVNQNNKITDFSNFGQSVVDIYSPGVGIFAPSLGGNWSFNSSGTSFSCAIVSGIAVQLGVSANFVANSDNYFLIDYLQNSLFNNCINFTDEICLADISFNCNVYSLMSGKRCTSSIVNGKFNSSKDEPIKNQITFFPNPISDELNIFFTNSPKAKVIIELYDFRGSMILRQEARILEKSSSVNLKPELPKGAYYVIVQIEGDYYFNQIIKG